MDGMKKSELDDDEPDGMILSKAPSIAAVIKPA